MDVCADHLLELSSFLKLGKPTSSIQIRRNSLLLFDTYPRFHLVYTIHIDPQAFF
jgi:hypothetical protein